MTPQPIVGVRGSVKPGTVASTAKYWSQRGLHYNAVVAKLRKKFPRVQEKTLTKWTSYWYRTKNTGIDFTRKNWNKIVSPKDLPSVKSSPQAIRSQIRIRTKHPLTGRKQEYHFTIDVGKSMTRKELLDEIRRKLIDHFLYYYEKRGIREQNIRTLISTLQITSLEGI